MENYHNGKERGTLNGNSEFTGDNWGMKKEMETTIVLGSTWGPLLGCIPLLNTSNLPFMYAKGPSNPPEGPRAHVRCP